MNMPIPRTTDKTFWFRGAELINKALQAGKVRSLHSAARMSGISYPTVHGWQNKAPADSPDKIQLSTLYAFLTEGLKMTDEEILNMRFGDVFAVVRGNEVLYDPHPEDPRAGD